MRSTIPLAGCGALLAALALLGCREPRAQRPAGVPDSGVAGGAEQVPATAAGSEADTMSQRYIVVLRQQPGDSATPPTAAALRGRIAAAVTAAGGTIVGDLAHLNAVVVDGVRDPAALRANPEVLRLMPDRAHSPPPLPTSPPISPPAPGDS